jgi:hypothetical protein
VLLARVNCQELHGVAAAEIPRLLKRCLKLLICLNAAKKLNLIYLNLLKRKEEASSTRRVPVASFKWFYAKRKMKIFSIA